MDAQQFLAEFGHIANAPGGVARLRELVLQLAISGRLVERGTQDIPVTELLVSASKQRDAYEERLGLRASRPHPPVQKEPYPIPDHWKWVRLENLALYIQRGKGPKYADRGDVRVVSQKCIQWDGFDSQQARFIADDSLNSYGQERFLCDGDLLWNSTGTGTAGRPAIFRLTSGERTVADSHVTVIRLTSAALSRYLWCVIASPWIQARIQPAHPDSLVSGTTQQVELATSTVRSLSIPHPPVEEQSRIVAKVDELMALCDKLESQQQERRKLQNALRKSTLQAVASAQSPHELKTTWARLEGNFERLFSEPGDVKELRFIILELSIRGLLTEQLTCDGDANELVQTIRTRQDPFARSPKTTRSLRPTDISYDEIPFSLPRNWAWARLSEVGYFLGGGTPSKSNPDYWNGDIPWVSPKDMKVTHISSSQDAISSKAVEETAVKLIPIGALLVVVRGMILAHSFPVAIAQRKLTINQDMKALCPHLTEMSAFLHVLLSGNKRRFLDMVERSTHGTCRLETERFTSCVVGIPPTPEQQRIVARVTELMRVCDSLEAQLGGANRSAEKVAVASVASLTGISIKQEEDEPVKAPQTELVAPLRLGQTPDIKAQAPLATLLARHNGEMATRDLWQRFGGEIDAFYAQLKIEVAHGWIQEPAVAEVREKATDTAEA